MTERDASGALLAATGVQIPGVLDDVYSRATDATLGPTFAGRTPSLAVWAPTARTVTVQLFDSPTATPKAVPMRRDDRTGVWSARGDQSWIGRYYRYQVRAWQPAAQKMVTASVTDPYSVALAADSTHSLLVDLDDAALAPAGWRTLRKPSPVPPAKAQVSELSVRDFSIADETVPAERRGTFLAFTDPRTAGMTHLKALGDAGVTHLHLLPAFDFATIPEKRADQRQPACDLAALPPDSAEQQKCVAAVAETDGYNWGTTRCTTRCPRAATPSTRSARRGPPSSGGWSPGSTAPVCGWSWTWSTTTRRRPARTRSRCSTRWCPATTTGCWTTVRWPTPPAAPTPPPSTP